MLDKYWKQFKSGTDIRGVATDGVEGQPVNLTDEVITKIAIGFGKWLKNKYPECPKIKVAVGNDSRLSGPRIRAAVISALSGEGIDVYPCGLSSTPAMFMTTVKLDCVGAVQITASHHPFHRNGLKFFCKEGGLDSPDITQILEYAQEIEDIRPSCEKTGTVNEIDFMDTYSAILRDMICEGAQAKSYDKPLAGSKIVVDAGNGAGGFYATKVLAPLGADITGSRFLDPDGRFPNHIPNPEDKDAMASIQAATEESHADLGVIFDTDVDRAGCVDSKGREINRNKLVALASCIAMEGNAGGTVVTDSITSSGLKTFIEETLKGKHHRFKRGYKNVINEAVRLNQLGTNAPLAIETSGHAAFKENYFLDDGAYLITRIIIKMAQLAKQGKTLDDLISDLSEPVEEAELRFAIKAENFADVGNGIIQKLFDYAKDNGWDIADDNHEGIRVSFHSDNDKGWFLLRLSVHDPIMPLNIESDVAGGVEVIAEKLLDFLSQQENLDISSIQRFLNK
ncbi:MAG: putative phosphoglucomutase [Oscillospiraceae bacterium]|nr:putative phosphoglucomutase [Oscillospiraceae bacterium]